MLKSTFLNLLGLIIPSAIAIPAMAMMARMLGVEKFGLFMLAFSLLGYASIFDGGLTRSVIRAIASHDNDNKKNKSVMGTATIIVMCLSAIAAILVAALTLAAENTCTSLTHKRKTSAIANGSKLDK